MKSRINLLMILTTAYSALLSRVAEISEDLIDSLVLDNEAREAITREYYTQEDIDVFCFNKKTSNDIDEAESLAYNHLDESILPDNFWND